MQKCTSGKAWRSPARFHLAPCKMRLTTELHSTYVAARHHRNHPWCLMGGGIARNQYGGNLCLYHFFHSIAGSATDIVFIRPMKFSYGCRTHFSAHCGER